MPVTKRGRSFQAAVYRDGRKFRRSFPTQSAAHEWLEQSEALITLGRDPSMTKSATHTFGDAVRATLPSWDELESGDLARRACAEFMEILGEETPLEAVTQSVIIERLVEPWRESGLAPSTINRKRSVFTKIMRFAVDRGWLRSAPRWRPEKLEIYGGVREGRRTRFLTAAEEAKLLAQIDVPPYHDLCVFLLETGLRPAEALRLATDDIDFDRRLFIVRQSKTGEQRWVPLSDRAMKVVQARDAELFRGLKQRALQRVVADAKAMAGIMDEDVVPYTFRHTFATRMVQRGCPLASLSRILGHASLQMTLRYAHHSPEELDAARPFLEPNSP